MSRGQGFLSDSGWEEKRLLRGWETPGTHPADKFSLWDVIFIAVVRTVLTSHQPVIDFPAHSNNFHVETTWNLPGQEPELFVCQNTVTGSSPAQSVSSQHFIPFCTLHLLHYVRNAVEQGSKRLCCKNHEEIRHWGDLGNNFTFKPVSGGFAKCTVDVEHGECCLVCSAAFEVVLTEYI